MVDTALLDVAFGRRPADTVVTGGRLVNVLTGEVYAADVAVRGERIAAVGDVSAVHGPSTETIDAGGGYLVPGLIDGHIHVECSKLSMTMFADLVVAFGTTSIVSGLDQIYVVAGLPGVRAFLDEAARTPLRVFWGAPTKAPYTVPESNVGHTFGPDEHRAAHEWPECVGLWETVREFVEYGDQKVLEALDLAAEHRLPVFGCAPMAGRAVAGLAAAGIAVDHESYSAEETLDKLRNGISVMLRESSVAPFLGENLRVVTEHGVNTGRIALCTDDISAADVLSHGHLDRLVRMVIEAGVDPVTAIQMATINCASMYGIDGNVGSIAPGRYADMLVVDDLEDFRARTVIARGTVAASHQTSATVVDPPQRDVSLAATIRLPALTADDLGLPSPYGDGNVRALAMSMNPEVAFVRKRRDVVLDVRDGLVQADVEQDVLYVAVVERYGKTSNRPVALVSGFGLRAGAMASSTAPDDNNIICVGTNSTDMAVAVNEIARAGGGQVVVRDGEVLGMLHLPIGGIVADVDPSSMAKQEARLDELARQLGCSLPSPFLYLIFLPITAIPDYAITDLGLIDCVKLEPTSPILGPVDRDKGD